MKKTTFLIIVLMLTILVLGGAKCGEDGLINDYGEEEEEEIIALTLGALKNANYYCKACNGWVKLEDGYYLEENVELMLRHETMIAEDIMGEEMVVYGDLNNDGKEDVAVIIISNFGGSGGFVELAVMINDNGNPVYLDSEILGDRAVINSINIQSGEIVLDMVVHGLDDAMCCPTLEKLVRYKISENELVEIE